MAGILTVTGYAGEPMSCPQRPSIHGAKTKLVSTSWQQMSHRSRDSQLTYLSVEYVALESREGSTVCLET